MIVPVTKGTGNTVSFDAGSAKAGGDPAHVVVPGTNSAVITVDDSGSIDGSGNLDFFGTVLTRSLGAESRVAPSTSTSPSPL